MSPPRQRRPRGARLSEKPEANAYVSDEVIAALKALETGAATDNQQKVALAWIVGDVCGHLSDAPFIADNSRLTDFLLGRRNVGWQIVEAMRAPLGNKETGEDVRRST